MSILGIGVDIVDNNRIKKLVRNKQFIARVFTNTDTIGSNFDPLSATSALGNVTITTS